MSSGSPRATCFVDMPFGKKPDLASGVEIDFDRVYQAAIKPAIEGVGLECVRGDEERTGGVIHAAMFARLLLAEFVVADLTLANPNVFYELGVRHAARPFTTVPIFAAIHPLPFDVALVRAIPYRLEGGLLTDSAAQELKQAIERRLEDAIRGPTTEDSPLFQLIHDFPGIDLPHEVTDVFQEQVRREERFRELLDGAVLERSNEEARVALLEVQERLGDLKLVPRNFLVALLLAYRRVEAWSEMVGLCAAMPDHVSDLVMVRQQWALALNRRNGAGDRDKAIGILDRLVE
ncbi:MAG TPA: TRAFs-binding domain-containing protein, partial [Longimicrobiales bacterium]|nr:TRAFs-binding domain-containing protein [Longimicrobiales bacterium]